MKAGTAQKVALNMISTSLLPKLGYTYRGGTVGVAADTDKQHRRVVGIVGELTNAAVDRVERALADSAGDARLAVLILMRGLNKEVAREVLVSAEGSLFVAFAVTAPGNSTVA